MREYNITLDEEQKLIYIEGISSKRIQISFFGDVDFTELVTELTNLIDNKEKLVAKYVKLDLADKSLELIINTIDLIISEYNNEVNVLIEREEVDLSE